MIKGYKHPASEAPKEVFRHCVTILRECARSMLLYNIENTETVAKINSIKEPLIPDYWDVVKHYQLTPREAVLLIFQHNISPC